MPETAALVPVPFYAPALKDTGPPFEANPDYRSRRRLLRQARPPVVAPPGELIYGREGQLVADVSVGRIVNLYI